MSLVIFPAYKDKTKVWLLQFSSTNDLIFSTNVHFVKYR